VVAIMALVAACVLVPADYFAINAAPTAFAKLGMEPVALPQLAQAVGEQLQGRPGGAVSLAVGMAYIFSGVPFMKHLTSYWYHFAIMFEAVFILTAVDTGTRVGRYLLQEMLGKVWPALGRPRALFSTLATSLLFTVSWGYLVQIGHIATIWPLFGMANQLLATCMLLGAAPAGFGQSDLLAGGDRGVHRARDDVGEAHRPTFAQVDGGAHAQGAAQVERAGPARVDRDRELERGVAELDVLVLGLASVERQRPVALVELAALRDAITLQVLVSLEGMRGAFFPLQFQTLAWVPARLAVEPRWSKVTVTGRAQAAYVPPLSGQRPASVSTGESA
jgi:hypothetical protein